MQASPLLGLALVATLMLPLASAAFSEAAPARGFMVIYSDGDLVVSNTTIWRSIVYIVEGGASLIVFDNVDIRGNVTVVTAGANISGVILSNVRGSGIELLNLTSPNITVVNSTLESLSIYDASSEPVVVSMASSRIGEFKLYSSSPILVTGLVAGAAWLSSTSNVTVNDTRAGLLHVTEAMHVEVSNSTLGSLVVGKATVPVYGVVIESSSVGAPGSINGTGRPGLVSVFARGSVYVEDSRLYLGRLHAVSGGLVVTGSWASAETLWVHAPSVVFEDSRVSIVSGRSTVGGEQGLVLKISNSTLNLQEPWIVYVSKGSHEARVEGSTLICPHGCLTLVLMDANLTANLTGSVFQGDPALVAVAYPPSLGRAVIVAGDCYFQSPLGPTVIVGGTIVRRGGSTIAVSGSAVGSVSVYSWRATASGPLLSPGAEAVDARVEPSTLVEYARASGAPGRLAVIAYSPVATATWSIEVQRYTVVAALAPTGWGVVEGGGGQYTVSLPRPSRYVIVFLEPERQVEPEASATPPLVGANTTTAAVEEDKGGRWGEILAAAVLAAGITAGYAAIRRGRS